MITIKDLTIEEYEKSLKRNKKENVISIAIHHIKKCRVMKKRLENLSLTVDEFGNSLGEQNYVVMEKNDEMDVQTVHHEC